MTCGELESAAGALAAGHRARGLAPGRRLASLMPNRVDLVMHYLACFKAGLTATPLNYRYTAREIDHPLEVSGASALLAVAAAAAVVGFLLALRLRRGPSCPRSSSSAS